MEEPVSASAPQNPYATPEHPPELERKVYSLPQILWGTFFGSVVCTAFMARNNLLAFKQPLRATITFWAFFLIGVTLMGTSLFLPSTSYLVDIAITIITLFAVGVWFNHTMRGAFTDYTRTTGRKASNWRTFAVIMYCLLGIIGVSIVIGAVCEITGYELPD